MTKIMLYTSSVLLLLASCGGMEREAFETYRPDAPASGQPDFEPPYCGDGICDSDRGEDEWWCIDCGYDPMIGGPADGGYCGDGFCFGGETMTSCFRDCRPAPFKPQAPWDPGWIDPPPWGDEPGAPLPSPGNPLPPAPFRNKPGAGL